MICASLAFSLIARIIAWPDSTARLQAVSGFWRQSSRLETCPSQGQSSAVASATKRLRSAPSRIANGRLWPYLIADGASAAAATSVAPLPAAGSAFAEETEAAWASSVFPQPVVRQTVNIIIQTAVTFMAFLSCFKASGRLP